MWLWACEWERNISESYLSFCNLSFSFYKDNKPLDDDEDRKNPQYIPKKGTFYEHDDRTAEDDAEKP